MQDIFKRVERKYYVSEEELNRLMDLLKDRVVMDSYSIDGGYKVYSTYFDNDTFTLTHRSVMKPYFKEKIRLRSYDSSYQNSFLEVKRKIGKVVVKRRIKINEEQKELILNQRKIPSGLSVKEEQIAKELIYLISKHDIKPKIKVSYDRIAYYDKQDKDFRITFDHNICYSIDEEVKTLVGNKEYVMEVKFLGNLPEWFVKLINKEKIWKNSFSKCGEAYHNEIKEKRYV